MLLFECGNSNCRKFVQDYDIVMNALYLKSENNCTWFFVKFHSVVNALYLKSENNSLFYLYISF